MRPILPALLLLATAAIFTSPARAQDYECDHSERWRPTDAQLQTILVRHKEWLSTAGRPDLDDERRANLCNANLTGDRLAKAAEQAGLSEINLENAVLNGANLREAKLDGANLRNAKLNGANLREAKLDGANLRNAKLNGANLMAAKLDGANLRNAKLNGANLYSAVLNCLNPGTPELRCANLVSAELNCLNPGTREERCASLRYAKLNGADLAEAKLNGVNLSQSTLNGAALDEAELNGANLTLAELNCLNPDTPEPQCANLFGAELNGANLAGAALNGADLAEAKLNGADLRHVDLRNAILEKTEMEGAKFDGALIGGAHFEPASAPDTGYLTNIKGISEVWFKSGNSSGLVKLRAALKEAGLRDLEREATYVIKRSARINAFNAFLEVFEDEDKSGIKHFVFNIEDLFKHKYEEKGGDLFGIVEAGFNYILFEVTTEWGMSPGRALIILAFIVLGNAVFYIQAVYLPTTGDGGIYRLWENDKDKKKDWVNVSGRRAVLWALYFSLLSAFHIGFRELNIGNWIQRINPHDYSVRATGWVKTLSGVQSVLSVYLLAIWALTYFGRPFD